MAKKSVATTKPTNSFGGGLRIGKRLAMAKMIETALDAGETVAIARKDGTFDTMGANTAVDVTPTPKKIEHKQ